MEEQDKRPAGEQEAAEAAPATPEKPQPPLPPEDPALRSQEAYQKLTMLGVMAFFIVVLVYNLFAQQTQYDVYAIGLGYLAIDNMMRSKLFGEKKRTWVSFLAMIGAVLSLAVHISLTFPH